MGGNVWEWVSTIYAPYPYTTIDGRESSIDRTSSRVFRGGDYETVGSGTSSYGWDVSTKHSVIEMLLPIFIGWVFVVPVIMKK